MSKAFVKEGSGDEADDDGEESAPAIPHGTKNYITPAGLRRMQDELRNLKTKERPHYTEIVSWAAGNGDRSENADYQYGKRKLREIDKRIRFLAKRLDNIEVVDPVKAACDQVRFGATVTIRDEDGSLKTYTIVGIDEMDMEKGRISWISPIANAMFKAHEGDYITFRTPKGVREVEVVKIEYLPID